MCPLITIVGNYNNTEDNLEKIMILEILEREYNENVEIERNKLMKKI